MNWTKKVIVVMPAYNAEKTPRATLDDIPKDWVDDILLVDDASKDGTVALARKLGLHVLSNRNNGYGGNQKTCYRKALKLGGEIMVMVHPDHQYDPTIVPHLVEPLLNGECDAVFGSRMLGGRPIEGGMPKWKYLANLFLTAVENATFYLYLTEYHSGLRAYSRRYLETVNFEAISDDFVFDTEIIAQGVAGIGIKFARSRSRRATSTKPRRSASAQRASTASTSSRRWSTTSSTRSASCVSSSSNEALLIFS